MVEYWIKSALLVLIVWTSGEVFAQQRVHIQLPSAAPARVQYGAEQLMQRLKATGYLVTKGDAGKTDPKQQSIELVEDPGLQLPPEGYRLQSGPDRIRIKASDASGILYGCLALCDRIKQDKRLPQQLSVVDAPEMVLRGQCIGLQKPYYLPGRTVYEYPYTPETFPWFYDKALWTQVLDSMVANRMNSLYLWNGHPFASLVRLKDYPYAVEVDAATFKKNEEMFGFLTREADKRGIWVIQMFYNIIVSKPFAEKHGIKTQERERPILPLIADYTRQSIAAFVEKYPNVGLMVCLGEAMEGVGPDDIAWFTKTIIPGVKDGLKSLGITKEPPLVLRAHDTDAPAVMKAALPLYKNLYTIAKFNGEALTYERPRGAWAELHQSLSRLGSVQIENVHILANLEPFRYGAVDFIQRSVQGMHEVMGGNGLHLYPQASYWDWPYAADSIAGGGRLLQIERDWLWYRAWSRYAWKAKRPENEEAAYWSETLAAHFGTDSSQGGRILKGYEAMGSIAPRLLRRFGITDGNRQTLTLGMQMTQLINPYRYGLFTLLYESESPEGESLATYADREWQGLEHTGETPVQVIREVREEGDRAVAFLSQVQGIRRHQSEFGRLKNDATAYQALAWHFTLKAEAALKVLRYKYSNELSDLDTARQLLQQSLDWYRKLTRLTSSTYLYANSMQTGARKIPISGQGGKFKHWTELLPVYEKELAVFTGRIDSLKRLKPGIGKKIIPLKDAAVTVNSPHQWYPLRPGARLFTDSAHVLKELAPELTGLRAIRTSFAGQIRQATAISFTSTRPVKVLVGFFKPRKAAFSKDTTFMKQPELETNASANDYGQAETKIANALVSENLPPLQVHSYDFPAGKHQLKLGKGVALILGFIDADAPLPVYDAGLFASGNQRQVDWLFE
ncbi:hypothetical protein GCM10027051_09370 [Niabella terrae]